MLDPIKDSNVLEESHASGDALLMEGTKILYLVAPTLLKTHEDRLMAQDNAGRIVVQHNIDSLPQSVASLRSRTELNADSDARVGCSAERRDEDTVPSGSGSAQNA